MIALHVSLGPQPIADMWLRATSVAGCDFLPLNLVAAITEEADAMRNYLRSYGYNLAHNRSRLWSVRRDGQRVATLRVAFRYRGPLPNIVEIKGPRNVEVSRELWWAARQWAAHGRLVANRLPRRDWGTATLDRTIWTWIWRPYWLAKRRVSVWLPLAPSRDALEAL